MRGAWVCPDGSADQKNVRSGAFAWVKIGMSDHDAAVRVSNAIAALLKMLAQGAHGVQGAALLDSRELAELAAANDAFARGVVTPDFTDKALVTAGEAEARSWRPQSSYRLVAVEWEDSQRPVPEWQWLDEFALPDAVRCISVGFLVAESDTAVALAANLGDVTQDRAQGCGIIRIPRCAVLQMADL